MVLPTCVDSDFAEDNAPFMTSGYVLPDGEGGEKMLDSCYMTPDEDYFLREMSCGEDGPQTSQDINCMDFGEGMKCLLDPNGAYCGSPICIDSDPAVGSASFLTSGYVLPAGYGDWVVFDSCNTLQDGSVFLSENTCGNDGVHASQNVDCSEQGAGFVCVENADGAYCGVSP